MADEFHNSGRAGADFLPVESIAWPECKKMLLNRRLTVNILSVVRGRPVSSDSHWSAAPVSLRGHLARTSSPAS